MEEEWSSCRPGYVTDQCCRADCSSRPSVGTYWNSSSELRSVVFSVKRLPLPPMLGCLECGGGCGRTPAGPPIVGTGAAILPAPPPTAWLGWAVPPTAITPPPGPPTVSEPFLKSWVPMVGGPTGWWWCPPG